MLPSMDMGMETVSPSWATDMSMEAVTSTSIAVLSISALACCRAR